MTVHRYDDALAGLQAAGRLPSVSGAVAEGGRAVWWGGVGEDPVPVPGTAYRIGSITKTMTAVLVLQLVEGGDASLDDPVRRFLPDAPHGDATLAGLLSHTAGLPSEPVGPWWERTTGADRAALFAANAGRAPIAGPGEVYHYSNLGFALLGGVLEEAHGRTWRELVADRLLGPLGMTATAYGPPPGRAPGWSVDHFTGVLAAEPHADTVAMAPAGQLWSTPGDLLTWAGVLAHGHPQVLGEATAALMRDPITPGYGLGVRLLDVDGHAWVGHTGSMPGFQASLFADPATGDAVAVLANATTGLRSDQVPVRMRAAAPTGPRPWHPTADLPDPVRGVPGLWFWGNTAYSLEWWGEDLRLRDVRTGEVGDRFGLAGERIVGSEGYHLGETLEVHRDARGVVTHLECATFLYTRTPYDPSVPAPGGHPDTVRRD
ncbi:beta-lactamase family protein [Nocardioides sp. GY 10113]|uniref:serine hydrolase domain-containing protein n=1 Tax=Nocardioides sp. GY 10113 TaxID=2569761 RepID=UPI0010A7FD4C|nr:serine hydrolase domain-containing protein [Nocardioides sp. GY 10113]TIC87634.1 beta-lactamase family protein [Nocardioides sp. GY 10113]